MRESITKLDLNFTNSGGGHTASVTSILGGKALDGSDGLGTVFGDDGQISEFSNPRIAKAMARFLCTQLTTSAGPTKKWKTRRYIDRTSMTLNSLIVLVRGIGCGPEGGEAEESIPYYSEVVNSPLRAYPSQSPKRRGSVIEAGRIYNHEAAAAYSGIKMSLVYNDHELEKDLSLNLDFVSDSYEANPDLAQYELKFGYTLADFVEILRLAGIKVKGLPSNKKVLFETSGTLSSVVSTVASYLGYFWFVDPDSGDIEFIDTATASALPVDNYTDTDNPKIINSSFTESSLTNKIVNTYTGTTEKREGGSQSRADMRSRKCFFKRLRIEDFPQFQKQKAVKVGEGSGITKLELSVFFALFNQDQSTDVFDKFTYAVTMLDKVPNNERPEEKGDTYLTKYYGRRKFKKFDLTNMYPYHPEGREYWLYLRLGAKKDDKLPPSIFCDLSQDCIPAAKGTKLRKWPDRLGREGHAGGMFRYYRLNFDHFQMKANLPKNDPNRLKPVSNNKMPRPSGSDLYPFLKAYFDVAGGIFVSNGYGEYKADRMQFTNTNNLTVCGPYKGDTMLHTIPELKSISDIFDQLKLTPTTIKEMAVKTKDRRGSQAQTKNNFFFVAIKSIPKLSLPIIDKDQGIDRGAGWVRGVVPKPVNFEHFIEGTELVENFSTKQHELFIGGPEILWKNDAKVVRDIITQSIANYKEARGQKDILPLKYMRSKTVVNKKPKDGEEAEDDEIANSDEGSQKESDLFDRFDMRYWGVEQPVYDLFNKLSLSGSSGSTVEMKALRAIRGRYRDTSYKPSSSSRTFYGLEIPKFTPTLNSISLSVGPDGIQTSVNESTVKIIPPDQSFVQVLGMEALTPKSSLPQGFSAGQRNVFDL